MSPPSVPTAPSNPAEKVPATPTSAASGPGGIKIAGFPQILYTRVFGPPDMLFVPLLDAARDAFKTVERLGGESEGRGNAVLIGSAQLASVMMRDKSFSLVATLPSVESNYTVDLDAGTVSIRTQLFAVVSRRTSLFNVGVEGKILEGPYTVRSPFNGPVIMVAEESKLRQPNAFSGWLSTECLCSQIEQERLGHLETTLDSPGLGDVRMLVPVGKQRIAVTLQQNTEGGRWDIIDGRRKECVGNLSPDAEKHLNMVISSLHEMFAPK